MNDDCPDEVVNFVGAAVIFVQIDEYATNEKRNLLKNDVKNDGMPKLYLP